MPAATSITADQFLALPEQYDPHGNRIKEESIEGEIVPMALPSKRHDLIKNRINELLVLYLATQSGLSLRALVEVAFRVSSQNIDIPDVSVVHGSRVSAEERIISGAPEIAIEVISPSETAAHVKSKVDAYLANGSESVWVVYPDQKSAVVHSGNGIGELRSFEVMAEPLLPGFSTPVSTFFED